MTNRDGSVCFKLILEDKFNTDISNSSLQIKKKMLENHKISAEHFNIIHAM